MPAINVKNLEKTYVEKSWNIFSKNRVKKTRAIRGIDFTVKKGEMFGIVGPNGAGKTTLINLISGLVYRDSGVIKVNGTDIEEDRVSVAEKMNVATAYSGLIDRLTLEENLKVFGKLYNVKDLGEKIDELLSLFEVEDLRDKTLYKFSTGQKTRANICKGLINDPEVLLLDEITAGLDPHIADVTRKTISNINQEKNTTILITSHNMRDIDELSERMMFLHNGEILRRGTPQEIKKDIHTKVLKITFENVSEDIENIVNELGGSLEDSTSQFLVNKEKDIKETLDKFEGLENQIIDIETKKPDLEEVFKKVARENI